MVSLPSSTIMKVMALLMPMSAMTKSTRPMMNLRMRRWDFLEAHLRGAHELCRSPSWSNTCVLVGEGRDGDGTLLVRPPQDGVGVLSMVLNSSMSRTPSPLASISANTAWTSSGSDLTLIPPSSERRASSPIALTDPLAPEM